jgi:hypothetical protein
LSHRKIQTPFGHRETTEISNAPQRAIRGATKIARNSRRQTAAERRERPAGCLRLRQTLKERQSNSHLRALRVSFERMDYRRLRIHWTVLMALFRR